MILVDTSVWIDYFADRPAAWVEQLSELLEGGGDVATCELVLVEVLQGIRDDRICQKTQEYLEALAVLHMTHGTFLRSVQVYRSLRKKGITIRNPVDCVIASVALENDVTLLHNDRDFAVIAEHFPLRTAL
jgi:predicted nucleic acid-binding protein